ncbi:MAG: FAD-binding oxidoreductase [Sporichthyaceae bacterium]|nr:FAD-binding oxidoreductase [Sporichthyaceae bacterium]
MDSTPPTEHPAVGGEVAVDVAVVGGGIAGLCTAWELARLGVRVAVVEADRVAAGTTGHTTAKLTALHTLIYAHLASALGEEVAGWYAQAQQEAIEAVAATVSELGIDCDFERRAAYTYVTVPDRLDPIRAEADATRRAGLPAEFVTDSGLPFGIAGAVRVADQAQFHPRRYLLALAADLIGRGGQIFEQSRVVDLKSGQRHELITATGGRVVADQVVLASGAHAG